MRRAKRKRYKILRPFGVALAFAVAVHSSVGAQPWPRPDHVSVNVDRMPFEDFLLIMGEFHNSNMIVHDELAGPVTIRFYRQSLDASFAVALDRYDRRAFQNGPVHYICKPDNKRCNALDHMKFTRIPISIDTCRIPAEKIYKAVEQLNGERIPRPETADLARLVTLRFIETPWDQVLEEVPHITERNLERMCEKRDANHARGIVYYKDKKANAVKRLLFRDAAGDWVEDPEFHSSADSPSGEHAPPSTAGEYPREYLATTGSAFAYGEDGSLLAEFSWHRPTRRWNQVKGSVMSAYRPAEYSD